MGGGPVQHAPAHRARTPGRPVRAMLVTPQEVTKFTPRLSPRAEQYEGTRLVFRIGPRSSSGSAFPIESGSDFRSVSSARKHGKNIRDFELGGRPHTVKVAGSN